MKFLLLYTLIITASSIFHAAGNNGQHYSPHSEIIETLDKLYVRYLNDYELSHFHTNDDYSLHTIDQELSNHITQLIIDKKSKILSNNIIKKLKNEKKLCNHFLSMLYLIYWKHPQYRQYCLETITRLCNTIWAESIDASTLSVILTFTACDMTFTPLTETILKKTKYDPNLYIEGYHLIAWCIMMDSPDLLRLIISKGADIKLPALEQNCSIVYSYHAGAHSPLMIGFLMFSHSHIDKTHPITFLQFRGNARGSITFRCLLGLLNKRERYNGIKLAQELYTQGCPVAIEFNEIIMLTHLLGIEYKEKCEKNSIIWTEQNKWRDLYQYIKKLEVQQLDNDLEKVSKKLVPLIIHSYNYDEALY